MKLKQIRYALMIAETGSFSKAAKKIYTSQPNISAAINSLETTLGFQIFERTSQGVLITPKGDIFLKHAQSITRTADEMKNISDLNSYKKLSVECMFNHDLIIKTFKKFCVKYKKQNYIDFTLAYVSSSDIVQNVYRNYTDLGIFLLDMDLLNSNLKSQLYESLDLKIIEKTRLNIVLRKKHPLLKEDALDLTQLYNYPYLNYSFFSKNNLTVSKEHYNLLSTGYIDLNKMINVNDNKARKLIIRNTNAFAIVPNFHNNKSMKQFANIPIPTIEMGLITLFSMTLIYFEEREQFIKCLLDEITNLKK